MTYHVITLIFVALNFTYVGMRIERSRAK